jgi:hypothetical protein
MPAEISAFFCLLRPNPDPGIIVEVRDLSLFKGGLDPLDTFTVIAFCDISLAAILSI